MRFLIFLFLLLLIGCATEKVDVGEISEVSFATVDGWRIKGTLYDMQSEKGIILLHMLNKDRKTWDNFARVLQQKGYKVLTVDLRGHGESEGYWENFIEQDFLNMVLDVQAARKFLGTKDVAIIGASIGANVGLVYGANEPDVKTLILLSPGREYRGVSTEAAAAGFKRPTLVLASERDTYSAKSALTISIFSKMYTVNVYSGDLHGTDMFAHEDENIEKIMLNWLKKHYSNT